VRDALLEDPKHNFELVLFHLMRWPGFSDDLDQGRIVLMKENSTENFSLVSHGEVKCTHVDGLFTSLHGGQRLRFECTEYIRQVVSRVRLELDSDSASSEVHRIVARHVEIDGCVDAGAVTEQRANFQLCAHGS
jgi:hypothetical protein